MSTGSHAYFHYFTRNRYRYWSLYVLICTVGDTDLAGSWLLIYILVTLNLQPSRLFSSTYLKCYFSSFSCSCVRIFRTGWPVSLVNSSSSIVSRPNWISFVFTKVGFEGKYGISTACGPMLSTSCGKWSKHPYGLLILSKEAGASDSL